MPKRKATRAVDPIVSLRALVKKHDPKLLYRTAVHEELDVENPSSGAEVLSAGGVHRSHVPFGKVYPNGGALVRALEKGDDRALATALDIVSRLEPDATAAVARAWFAPVVAEKKVKGKTKQVLKNAPTGEQWRIAGFALGRSRRDDALEALIAPLASGAWDGVPYGVFEPNAHPELCPRILALLNEWIAKEDERATVGLSILGLIRDVRAVKPLGKWLRAAKGDVAVGAARALGEIGGHEVQQLLVPFVTARDEEFRDEVLEAIARAVPERAFDVLAPFVSPRSPKYNARVASEMQELVDYDIKCRERGWNGERTNLSLDPRWSQSAEPKTPARAKKAKRAGTAKQKVVKAPVTKGKTTKANKTKASSAKKTRAATKKK